METQIEAMRMQLAAEQDDDHAIADDGQGREPGAAGPRAQSLRRNRPRTTNGKRT